MSLGLAEDIRNAWADAIASKIDGGSGRGILRIYDGPRPGTAGAPTTLLAELTFSKPCAPAARKGAIRFSDITPDSDAKASGRASWARAVDSEGGFAADLDVGLPGSDADIVIDGTLKIEKGQIVSVLSGTIAEGNP